MSSHYQDARKIEAIMITHNMDKSNKNLPMICSQDLDLSIKYVKDLLDSRVKSLEHAKVDEFHTSIHFKRERQKLNIKY